MRVVGATAFATAALLGAAAAGAVSPAEASRVAEELGGAAAPPAPVTFVARDALLEAAGAAAEPLVAAALRLVSVPPGSAGPVRHAALRFDDVTVGAITASAAPPAGVAVTLSGLALRVPPTPVTVHKNIGVADLACSGFVSGGVSGATVVATVQFGWDAVGARLTPAAVAAAVDAGVVRTAHRLDSAACELGADLFESLAGDVNAKVAARLRAAVPPMLQRRIDEALVRALRRAPVAFLGPPVAAEGAVTLTIDALSATFAALAGRASWVPSAAAVNRTPQRLAAEPLRQGPLAAALRRILAHGSSGGPNAVAALPFRRALAVGVPAASADAVLELLRSLGALAGGRRLPLTTDQLRQALPVLSERCPRCPLTVDIRLPVAPVVDFSGGLGVTIRGAVIKVGGAPPGRPAVPLLSLRMNVTVVAEDLRVEAAEGEALLRGKLSIPDTAFEVVGCHVGDRTAVVAKAQMLAKFGLKSAALPAANMALTKGVPLPRIPLGRGLSVNSLELANAAGALAVGLQAVA